MHNPHRSTSENPNRKRYKSGADNELPSDILFTEELFLFFFALVRLKQIRLAKPKKSERQQKRTAMQKGRGKKVLW